MIDAQNLPFGKADLATYNYFVNVKRSVAVINSNITLYQSIKWILQKGLTFPANHIYNKCHAPNNKLHT